MKNAHLGIIGLSFITIFVSLYYGASIQNTQDNFLIEHLNSSDGLNYYPLDYVPTLSYKAAIVTLFFLVIGFGIQLMVFFKTSFKRVKNLAVAALICFVTIFIFDFLTLSNPHYYNFKHYGMIWVLLSLSTIFMNGISIFVRK